MVWGADMRWTLRRLAFTIDSLRATGAVSPVVVLVPNAAWAAAGAAAATAAATAAAAAAAAAALEAAAGAAAAPGPLLEFLVADFVPTPAKCFRRRGNSESAASERGDGGGRSATTSSSESDTGPHGSYEYWAPSYMQFSALLLTRYDAVAYIDALDVHVRGALEPALAEFERGDAAFAAAPDAALRCGTGGYMNTGVFLVRPSRALYWGVSRYGDDAPADTQCAFANQDALNAAIPVLLGTSRIECLGPDVHYMPAYDDAAAAAGAGGNARTSSITHFAGPWKPWQQHSGSGGPGAESDGGGPGPGGASRVLLDAIADYRAAYAAWDAARGPAMGAS